MTAGNAPVMAVCPGLAVYGSAWDIMGRRGGQRTSHALALATSVSPVLRPKLKGMVEAVRKGGARQLGPGRLPGPPQTSELR